MSGDHGPHVTAGGGFEQDTNLEIQVPMWLAKYPMMIDILTFGEVGIVRDVFGRCHRVDDALDLADELRMTSEDML